MNRIERVAAVIEGRLPDRPPISFWHHFPPDCAAGQAAVDAHVRHVETFDVDFLKIMDDNRYPRIATNRRTITQIEDLDRLSVLGGDEDTFGRQLALITSLRRRFSGELRMATTVFNTWGTLRQMTQPDTGQHGPPSLDGGEDPRDAVMSRFLREAPQALERALGVIGESLANFTRNCLQSGADGIFLSVRDDWVDTPVNGAGIYNRFVQPSDLVILQAAEAGPLNILHVCGKAIDFRRFAGYPAGVLSWADRYAGPTIAEVAPWARPALCAGLNNLGTLVGGTPQQCAAEVADALAQAAPRPMIVAPGCTYDPDCVPAANLHAVRRAVEHA
jgi:uroporphyrinogen decarboxylase